MAYPIVLGSTFDSANAARMLLRTSLTGLLVLGLIACTPASANESIDDAHHTLAAGTLFQVTTRDSLSSRRDQAGQYVTAAVSADIQDARGQVVIPAGSLVTLRIAQLEPTSTSLPDGVIVLKVIGMTVRGQAYPVSVRVEPAGHRLEGRNGAVSRTAGHWATSDVVVPRGTAILFVLPQPLIVGTR